MRWGVGRCRSDEFDVSGGDAVGVAVGLEDEAAEVIEAGASADNGGLVFTGLRADLAADEHMVAVVLLEKRGEGLLELSGEGSSQIGGDGDECIGDIEVVGGDGAEGGDAISKGSWCVAFIEVDVDAEADEVEAVDAFAEEAGELAAVVDDVVRPFEADVVVAGKLGGGVADGEAGDERDLVWAELFFDGEGEGDGEAACGGPPGVGSAASAGGLVCGEDDGGCEESAGFAESGGVIVGGAEAGEPVEAEGFEVGVEA